MSFSSKTQLTYHYVKIHSIINFFIHLKSPVFDNALFCCTHYFKLLDYNFRVKHKVNVGILHRRSLAVL